MPASAPTCRPPPAAGPACSDLRLDLRATADAVRMALGQVMAEPALAALPIDQRGTVEIVLAEVLNNIVEHAYAGAAAGWISLRLICTPAALLAEVGDTGIEMPGLRPPAGRLADLGDDLPEGGFGWYLIRSLTTGLGYERRGGANLLRFAIPLG